MDADRTPKKAVVPIAGLGTRIGPWARAVPKAMLPMVPDGRVVPVLGLILEELASAGIERVALIVSPGQTRTVNNYIDAARKANDTPLPDHIDCLLQDKPEGFGDAVARAEPFVDGKPFVLMLGDHIYRSLEPPCCTAQVVHAFTHFDAVAMIGMQTVDADELPKVGVATGTRVADRVYRCTDFVEKPDPDTAAERLVTDGEFLAHCGIYVFTPAVFDALHRLADQRQTGCELQLADAQSILLDEYRDRYFLYHISGTAYDTGTVEDYANAFHAWRQPENMT